MFEIFGLKERIVWIRCVAVIPDVLLRCFHFFIGMSLHVLDQLEVFTKATLGTPGQAFGTRERELKPSSVCSVQVLTTFCLRRTGCIAVVNPSA
jgi:hypothetical protein